MYKFYKDIIVSLRSCLTTTLPLPGPARWPDKTSRIRISATVAFLFIALMQVSATATAQTVTLVENKSRLATVLEKMRKQTGYDFMYSTATLRGANPVTISVKNVPLERVLTAIFESQPLQCRCGMQGCPQAPQRFLLYPQVHSPHYWLLFLMSVNVSSQPKVTAGLI